MSPEQTRIALGGQTGMHAGACLTSGQRLAAAEALYITAVRNHEAVPAGIEHGAERLKAWSGIKAAKRGVVNALWAKGELSDVVDLGEYVGHYFRALREQVAGDLAP